jgi:hypothetical protein
MKRALGTLAALGLAAVLVLGCGKYGPPRRIVEAPSAAPKPDPTATTLPQGSSILAPTHSPPAPPGPAPEEPEEDPFP